MRQGTLQTFPELRRAYRTAAELGEVINKDRTTVQRKFKTGFTPREQSLILEDLRRRGLPTLNIFEG